MSFDDRFQPESKYNLETFPVWPIPYVSNIPKVFRREKKNRCYAETKYARRLESRFHSLFIKIATIAKRFKFALRYAFLFGGAKAWKPFF